ncbi:MAG: hypothetical protein L0287_20185 [Anaerolineae bacterium]|nr:hypothetical protein [Anaerolineae bacterium]
MSVEVRDFRQFSEKKQAELAATERNIREELVPQVATEQVGNEDFDKLLRAIQAASDVPERECEEVKKKGMGAVQDEMIRLCQLQYMFICGKLEGFKEVKALIHQIVREKSA